MRRFELIEGTSNKFWEIDLAENAAEFTVRFGRIATNGQTQTKAFETPAKASAESAKLVAEKIKKGYAEVAVNPGAALSAAPAPRASEAASPPAPSSSGGAGEKPRPDAADEYSSTAPMASLKDAPPPTIIEIVDEDRIFWDDWARKRAPNPTHTLELLSIMSHPPAPSSVTPGTFYRNHGYGTPAASLVHRFGHDALPVLLGVAHEGADATKEWAGLVARIGSDEAFAALIEHPDDRHVQGGFADACRFQPARAIRLLSAVSGKREDAARLKLAELMAAHGPLVEALRPALASDQLQRIDALAGARPTVLAPQQSLPAVLRESPWNTKTAAAVRLVVPTVQVAPVPAIATWGPGERQTAMAQSFYDDFATIEHLSRQLANDLQVVAQVQSTGAPLAPSTVLSIHWLRQRVERTREHIAGIEPIERAAPRWIATGTLTPAQLLRVPEPLVASALRCRPMLGHANWRWQIGPLLRRILATFDIAAESYLAAAIAAEPTTCLGELLNFGSSFLAPAAAAAFASKKGRTFGRSWLLRFPQHAAAGLMPAAIGPFGKSRDAAEAALRLIAADGHAATIRSVAATATPDVAAAVEAVIGLDPLSRYPSKRPSIPTWVVSEVLAPVELCGGEGALPEEPIRILVTMLTFSKIDDPYAGIDVVKGVCTSQSLGRFAWTLFQQWQGAGAPSAHSWAFTALGLLGDDEVALKLAALVRVWPGEGGHARAVAGLGILAAIGSDVSLMHLNSIAERAKFKGLKEKAKEAIAHVAETRGLTQEELADRLVPDLGLDDQGTLWLDYGSRRFQVGFDQLLAPFVRDESGAKLRSLPKPKANDDPEAARSAAERWKALKKDATEAAKVQIRRLELAMTLRRRWDAPTFHTVFVSHPLMVHAARRLVWGTYGPDGELTSGFRVAEDRSFADVDDETWLLPDDATIGVPHALEIGTDSAGRWGDLFADYELLPPFSQLARETYAITPEERQADECVRIKGWKVHFGKLLGLEYKGWCRGDVADAGIVHDMFKPLADGRFAVIALDPGLWMSGLSESPEQMLESLVISHSTESRGASRIKLGELDPIDFSELVRDMEMLRA